MSDEHVQPITGYACRWRALQAVRLLRRTAPRSDEARGEWAWGYPDLSDDRVWGRPVMADTSRFGWRPHVPVRRLCRAARCVRARRDRRRNPGHAGGTIVGPSSSGS